MDTGKPQRSRFTIFAVRAVTCGPSHSLSMTPKHLPRALDGSYGPTILIVVASLAAEGTPRLALELSRVWMARGMRPVVAVMHETPDDLRPDFDALGVEYVNLGIPHLGYARYVKLTYKLFALARHYRACALLSMP